MIQVSATLARVSGGSAQSTPAHHKPQTSALWVQAVEYTLRRGHETSPTEPCPDFVSSLDLKAIRRRRTQTDGPRSHELPFMLTVDAGTEFRLEKLSQQPSQAGGYRTGIVCVVEAIEGFLPRIQRALALFNSEDRVHPARLLGCYPLDGNTRDLNQLL